MHAHLRPGTPTRCIASRRCRGNAVADRALIVQRMLIGGAAAAVVALGVWAWGAGASVPVDVSPSSPAQVPAPDAALEAKDAARSVNERTLIGPTESVVALPHATAAVAAALVRAVVVDGKDDPVPDA